MRIYIVPSLGERKSERASEREQRERERERERHVRVVSAPVAAQQCELYYLYIAACTVYIIALLSTHVRNAKTQVCGFCAFCMLFFVFLTCA